MPPRTPTSAGSDVWHDVLRALGRLEEGQERMRADFDEEKEYSRESRGKLHEKMDRLDGKITIAGQVAAQAREEAKAVKRLVDEDVKPATDDFRKMRALGFGLIALLGFAFTAFGITLATVGEGVVNGLRHWLRIT